MPRQRNEVDMIVHQAIPPVCDPFQLAEFLQQMQVVTPVIIVKKDPLTPIAALDDMVRTIGNNNSWNARNCYDSWQSIEHSLDLKYPLYKIDEETGMQYSCKK